MYYMLFHNFLSNILFYLFIYINSQFNSMLLIYIYIYIYIYIILNIYIYKIYIYIFKTKFKLWRVSPHRIVAKVVDYDIVGSEFELHSSYYVHVQTNLLGKDTSF